MNIALIQPHNYGVDIEPPKGLASLSAYLCSHGHEAKIIDLQIRTVRDRWEDVFREKSYDLVGLTATTQQIKEANEIALKVRGLKPDAKIILGGVHCSVLPEKTLEDFPVFDACVIGEGEITILEIVNRMKMGMSFVDETVKGVAFSTPQKNIVTERRPRLGNLDLLPIHHDFYDFEYYLDNNTLWVGDNAVSLIVSRGCPYNCQFCATRNFWTNRYVCKSVESTIAEIKYVINKGAKSVRFRDSTFVINKNWVRELCEKILEENLVFDWDINARANFVDYDLFKLMKKAGLGSVFFGVESGSQKILDFYGKGITLEQVENAFAICKKLKIFTGAYWMIGVLPETREDMELTYQFAKKIKADKNYVFIFMPLPGSELYDYYIDNGFEFEYEELRTDKALFHSASGYSLDELSEIRSKWFHDFNLPPNIVNRTFHQLLSIRSTRDLKKIFQKIERKLHHMVN